MKRRQFIAGLGGAAAWPVVARAQQGDRVRRIGFLTGVSENDREGEAGFSAFAQRLADLGWTVGRNVQVDVRFLADNVDRVRTFAKELVDLQPDVILANTTPGTAALQRETLVIPIVFMAVSDPVGSGFVASLHRPGREYHRPQSCSIPIRRPVVGHTFWPHSRQRPDRSNWSR
jgi:putative ABC transport system substrate-binding protein